MYRDTLLFLLLVGSIILQLTWSAEALAAPRLARQHTLPHLTLCAEPQFYGVVHALKQLPDLSLHAVIDTTSVLYAGLANRQLQCDVVLAGFGELTQALLRSGRVPRDGVQIVARSPLIVAAHNPGLLRDGVEAIVQRRLRSLAIPRASGSAVGHAAAHITRSAAFPTRHMQARLQRPAQEFQVLDLLERHQVQAGFLTLPLLQLAPAPHEYSYWKIPSSYYPPLWCYAMLLHDTHQPERSAQLLRMLKDDSRTRQILHDSGFEDAECADDSRARSLPGWGRRPPQRSARTQHR